MHVARNKQGKLRVDMNITEGLASRLRFCFALSYVLTYMPRACKQGSKSSRAK